MFGLRTRFESKFAKMHFALIFICNILLLSEAVNLPTSETPVESSSAKLVTGSEYLDGENKYLLSWQVDRDKEIIHFEINAKTRGYVGFGLSPNGGMAGADILIAGVNPDSTVYSSDRHALDNSEPVEDAHQNWIIDDAKESEDTTKIKFHRSLKTCDENDIPIMEETIRVIWAIGDSDEIKYHTKRGTKSVNFFLSNEGFDTSKYEKLDIAVTMEMPAEHTTYWCTIHKLPTFSEKQHIVSFEPILESPEATEHTHHFIFHRCIAPSWYDADEFFGPWTSHEGEHCYNHNGTHRPFPFDFFCLGNMQYAWAKGGKPLVFPNDMGLPIGETPGGQEYWALEVHYDNPKGLQGLKFRTGGRIYYTPEIRQKELGLWMVEHRNLIQLTIPPMSSNFVIAGHCSGECTEQLLPENGVSIVNVMLHGHLSTRKVMLRHFRGGEELSWIDQEPHYDFNFQQSKPLNQQRKVMRGDQLTVECSYNTMNVKDGKAVIGGWGSHEEMCQAWLYYYPRQTISFCASVQDEEEHYKLLGLPYHKQTTGKNSDDLNFYDLPQPGADNENVAEYLQSVSYNVSWTRELRERYQHEKRFGKQNSICYDHKERYKRVPKVQYPTNLTEYKTFDENCESNGVIRLMGSANNTILIAIMILFSTWH